MAADLSGRARHILWRLLNEPGMPRKTSRALLDRLNDDERRVLTQAYIERETTCVMSMIERMPPEDPRVIELRREAIENARRHLADLAALPPDDGLKVDA